MDTLLPHSPLPPTPPHPAIIRTYQKTGYIPGRPGPLGPGAQAKSPAPCQENPQKKIKKETKKKLHKRRGECSSEGLSGFFEIGDATAAPREGFPEKNAAP